MPSIPESFFEFVGGRVAEALGRPLELWTESSVSGPGKGGDDPVSRGEVELAFMCSPSYCWLAKEDVPRAELLPVAPVFRDPRANGRPVYFSDVVVAADSPWESVEQLTAARWVANDRHSLSGCLSIERWAESHGVPWDRESVAHSGGHLLSLDWLERGDADAAAIDSNVLRRALAEAPERAERFRVVGSWGPFPIQPLVVPRSLPAEVRQVAVDVLVSLGTRDHDRARLHEFDVQRFAPVRGEDYACPD